MMVRSRIIFISSIIAIAVNCYYLAPLILNNVKEFQRYLYFHPPGQVFIGLRPYLKDILEAGYYNDHRAVMAFSDFNSMFSYQQSQFCLSPTLLDYYNPFAHEFIIFNCKDQKSARRKITEIHGHVIAVTKTDIMLVQRDK